MGRTNSNNKDQLVLPAVASAAQQQRIDRDIVCLFEFQLCGYRGGYFGDCQSFVPCTGSLV